MRRRNFFKSLAVMAGAVMGLKTKTTPALERDFSSLPLNRWVWTDISGEVEYYTTFLSDRPLRRHKP